MKTPRQKNLLTPIVVAVTLLASAAGIWWLASSQQQVAPAEPQSDAVAAEQASANLAVDLALHDFGTVPMSGGKVTHDYAVSNTSSEPIQLSQLYTSCMCTEATLVLRTGDDERSQGPFGMPGHGGTAGSFDEVLEPGATATVRAMFDPNAHGPAGVGPIDRTVTLGTSDGALQLRFTGTVTP